MVRPFRVANEAEALRLAVAEEIPSTAELAVWTHRLFHLNVDGADVVCKVFRLHHGDEVEREWDGLKRMFQTGLDLAPAPLARSEKVILMSWCSGEPIVGPSDALRNALSAMYSLKLQPPSRVVRSAPSIALARIESVSANLDVPPRVSAWLRSDEAESLRHVHLRNFVRGDGNLNNMLIDGDRVRFVDFEDCGRGDWALDLAELIEHSRSRVVPDATWMEFFESFGPKEVGRHHFASARRLYAIFWLILLLRRPEDDRTEIQRERVEELLDAKQ